MKLSQKEKDDLTIRKQKSECKICNHRGYIIIVTVLDGERKAQKCECMKIKKPEAVLPFKDDMSKVINNF